MSKLITKLFIYSRLTLVSIFLLVVPYYVESNEYLIEIPVGLIEPDIPLNNKLSKLKIELGKKIFFDKRLSSSSKFSCATCHDPTHGFAEKRSISINSKGELLERNSPSVLNTGYQATLSWDGRFKSLEEQALNPFTKNGDMGIEIEDAINKIDSFHDYDGLFETAFGKKVDTLGLAQSLASFQRSLISANSRFDDYLFNGNKKALTKSELDGYEIFIGKGSCIACHDIFHPSVNSLGGGIALFTDHRFHNLGVGYKNGKMTDTGRYWVTRKKEDWGAFKTPILRNVALTPPYMHDGSLESLFDVVEFYNKGGNPNPNIAPGIRPLLLNEIEINSLVSFLRALTDENLINSSISEQHRLISSINARNSLTE
ncbi:cytochrome-c peroxidase [Aliikangiella coralliicola]|uniref:Cytochrome-c peroxidase n=1 Tax=Aliikangiella coralliicola TaxID=2592383 RepID=A0A545UGW0_9GAMM|nr:cytochrome c peroxidase [Aliikangiella coralliicola]TQV88700.1 cytochrome-c peroxidase [Aliikangiella coralliicola]